MERKLSSLPRLVIFEGSSTGPVKAKGFARLNIPPPENYAPHAEGNFPTPTGKCEFKATMAEKGNFVLPLFRQGYDGQQLGDPVESLPHYIPPKQSVRTNADLSRDFPLNVISPKSHTFISSNYGNLQQQLRQAGEQSVTLNPVDAAVRNIQSGQTVHVSSPMGSYTAVCLISDDTIPGVVVAPVGFWRHSSRSNATVQSVMPSTFADLGAAPTFSDVLVQVEGL